MSICEEFEQALKSLDTTIEQAGLPVWVGAEPTYTDRFSEASEWLHEALGKDKRARAEEMLRLLATSHYPGAAVLRTIGRQYGGEEKPRWSLGVYSRRDGVPVWQGPRDPLIQNDAVILEPADPVTFASELARGLVGQGLRAIQLGAPWDSRVVFRCDGNDPPTEPDECPALQRSAVQEDRVEGSEAVDEFASDGNYLVSCGLNDGSLNLELPSLPSTMLFQKLLDTISQIALSLSVPALVLRGYPPPVDRTVAWMTLTADPAVVEANMAPASGGTELYQRLREIQDAAARVGLSSYRLHYNGIETDSGGGGQITLGGPSPEQSPFLSVPNLLPGIIRYFNRHPSLSYLFTVQSVGPSSQSPRPDECRPDAVQELGLALRLLAKIDRPSPETIWAAVSPFLSDPSGNSHRAEINVEKLWNPRLGQRGRQGLVEFRAFRMGASPHRTVALAAMLRAVVAMLAQHPYQEPLADWGSDLHDKFSLPYHLQADLRAVLKDLQQAGFGLGEPLVRELLDDQDLVMTSFDLGNARCEIRRATEFWPLVGDVATQEEGGSRLIDSSTARLEIRLYPRVSGADIQAWHLTAGDWKLPLQTVKHQRLVGLRYRSFTPWRGLHPSLAPQIPLTLTFSHPHEGTWQVVIHEWHPAGEAYHGLPSDISAARQRREERCVVGRIEPIDLTTTVSPPNAAIGNYVVDLRWQ